MITILKEFFKRLSRSPKPTFWEQMEYKKGDIENHIISNYGHSGRLVEIFSNELEFSAHKWHHYLPIYENLLSPFIGKNINLLEIGVNNGGSLELWRKYLGPNAKIHGIDINPRCKKYDGIHGNVSIGSQIDVSFLNSVLLNIDGKLNVVIDDGSHQMDHISLTLETIFPYLEYGGIYVIEDLHTAYKEEYGGGLYSSNNFFKTFKTYIDQMHSWYIESDKPTNGIGIEFESIQVFDSMVVIKKGRSRKPVNSRVNAQAI